MAKKVLLCCLDSIFIVVFNLFFFLITGTEHVTTVWVAYVFLHLSYILLFLSPLLVHKEKVFSIPIYLFSSIHFILQLAVAIVFTVLEKELLVLVLLLNIGITAGYLFALTGVSYFNQADAETLQTAQANKAFISECSAKLKNAYNLTEDKACAKIIDRAYYTVFSSPVQTTRNAYELELQIIHLTDEVYVAVKQCNYDTATSLAQSIIEKTNERNHLLSTSNG